MFKKIISLVVVLLLLAGPVMVAEAGGHSKDDRSQCFVENKFCKKVKMIMSNSDEMGVTEKQLDEIKALKIATKKDVIKKNAEMDILKLDLKSELYNDMVDEDKIDALLDKMTGIKNTKMKNIVASYAKLKNEILTKEQKDKMSEIYKKYKKSCGTRKK